MSVSSLREEIDRLNAELLDVLCRRGKVVEQIGRAAQDKAQPHHPEREEAMLLRLVAANEGPYPDEVIRHLFRDLFRASMELKVRAQRPPEQEGQRARLPSVVAVGEVQLGKEGWPQLLCGPIAVESGEQIESCAAALGALGVRLLRAGLCARPSDGPEAAREALGLLSQAAARNRLKVVSEVCSARQLERIVGQVDLLEVGPHQMANLELLEEVGRSGRPVLLQRGTSASLQELLAAAERVWVHGGGQIVLCEGGIRTFESSTRRTLDLAAVALLKQESGLPVLVDLCAPGRKDLIRPLARAALAAGADGVMVFAHPRPHGSRSEGEGQLNLEELGALVAELRALGLLPSPGEGAAAAPGQRRSA